MPQQPAGNAASAPVANITRVARLLRCQASCHAVLSSTHAYHVKCLARSMLRAYAHVCHKASHLVTSRQPRYRRYTRYRAHA